MSGWKTWTGAAIYAIGAWAGYYLGIVEFTQAVSHTGEALIAIGVAHKIEKSGVR